MSSDAPSGLPPLPDHPRVVSSVLDLIGDTPMIPIRRIGRDRMVRNCLIAAGNSRDAALLPSVERHLHTDDPVIADAAAWARDHLLASICEMQPA